ncbi:HNH endonuclease [Deinococcus saxicola]|uniref:HNH endonuclease n=1 Tax=Deinococcus saxicola TaxID=249406 RepID=UPI0039EE4487
MQRIIAAQRGCCFYCQSQLDFNTARAVQVDHFIPLTRGGQNGPDNIVVACASCNGSKNDRMPWEWMPDRFLPPAPTPTP